MPEKPRVVDVAVKLMYLTLLVGLIRVAFEWREMRQLASSAFILSVVGTSIGFVAWLTYMIDHGRNWARITALILTVLGAPLSIPGTLEAIRKSPVAGGVDLVQSLVQVVALVMIFTPAARPWFHPEPPLPSEVH